MSSGRIIILGAGLVGSLLSIYLRKAGFTVSVYEKRKDPRKSNLNAGRSINLALSLRGIRALEGVGLAEDISKMVIPMLGRKMHDPKGNITFQPYGKDGQFINSISRGDLNELLVRKAEELGVEINFEHRCLDVDLENGSIQIEHDGSENQLEGEWIIGADGAFSAMRQAFMRSDRFSYQQQYIEHGYKELSMPASGLDFALDADALHIWPRGSYMLIALPNQDKTFTCTLFFPFEGDPSFDSLQSDEDIMEFFSSNFQDAVDRIPDLVSQYNSNPTSSLVTVRCHPWSKGKCLLLGDASHAIVPFYGQGMNAGFEDCYLIAQLAESMNYDWPAVLRTFSQSRKKDADAISDLALQNFIEMRDRVADPDFLLQKRIEAQLHERYPNEWIPQYTMVTFSHMPYSEALRRGQKQNELVQSYIRESSDPESIDLQNLMNKYRSILEMESLG